MHVDPFPNLSYLIAYPFLLFPLLNPLVINHINSSILSYRPTPFMLIAFFR
jgi:hypothetical protein